MWVQGSEFRVKVSGFGCQVSGSTGTRILNTETAVSNTENTFIIISISETNTNVDVSRVENKIVRFRGSDSKTVWSFHGLDW